MEHVGPNVVKEKCLRELLNSQTHRHKHKRKANARTHYTLNLLEDL
jgi:hypothetical protein